MSTPPPTPQTNSTCLRNVAEQALRTEPSIEAIRFHRPTGQLSFASLGQQTPQGWEQKLHPNPTPTNPCALLSGQPSCTGCPNLPPPAPDLAIEILQSPETIEIRRTTCPTAPRFWRWREFRLPRVEPRRVVLPDHDHDEQEWKYQLAAAIACALFATAGHFAPQTAAPTLYLLSYIAGAWFPAIEVIERLRQRVVDVHFLMLLVAAGSASIGAWKEGAILLFLFSLSGALEHFALGRTNREIRALFKETPKTACSLDPDGRETNIDVDQITPGLLLRIKPGQLFPVDAEITSGSTATDESSLTGEATPVDKSIGDTVLSGTINLWGSVDARALRPASQSTLEQMIRLIREAQHLKAPSQRFTDRFGSTYTYGIIALSTAMFLARWKLFGAPPFTSTETTPSAFYSAMTLLVVASPCALVLSIPSAILAAIAWAARRGILFRGGAAIENLATIKAVALDKTGTLTTGDLRVERIECFPPGREKELLSLAFNLERLSTHPLARAIVRQGRLEHLPELPVSNVQSVAGAGITGLVQQNPVRLGKRSFINPQHLSLPSPTSQGLSEVWIQSPSLLGRIILRDEIRPAARPLLQTLHQNGIQTIVLTGDNTAAATQLKQTLNLDQLDVRAELHPQDKVNAIRALEDAGIHVAMIGDGVNDAPSLAAAHVGVAMGARGADAALEQADLVLMKDRLENFLAARELSLAARTIIRQNIAISLGSVLLLAASAIAGILPLSLGVLGHEGSTVIVVLNSLRLLFLSPSTPRDLTSLAPAQPTNG